MRPKKPKKQPQDQLFQIRLDVVCDPVNSLVKLADRIDWDNLDEQFATLYSAEGRPAIATRMMVGLTLLRRLYSFINSGICVFIINPAHKHQIADREQYGTDKHPNDTASRHTAQSPK